MSMDGLFTAKESAIKPPPMKPIFGSQSIHPLAEPLSLPDEATLASMDKPSLVALIMRMARQCGLVAMMSEQEINMAFLDRMAYIGLTGKAAEALNAMEKRMDRTDGKPMQRQQSMIAVADATKPLPENDRAALEHYFKIRGLVNA